MKTTLLIMAWLTLGFAGGLFAAEATNGVAVVASTRGDFVAFQIVSERNIFNPHRSKRSGERPPPTRMEPEKRVTMDRFALLGTMSYEKGRFAFFDGSSLEFRKVARPEDLIAGFKITEIAPTCVKLQLTNGTLLELCVGMQMKRSEDADWQLAGRADGSNGSSSSGSSSSSGNSTPESDDVLKRLLQRREQDGASTAAAPVEAAKPEEPKAAAAPGEADEVLKKLLQKREQELNK